jgi:hypothetical protein
MHLSAIWCAVKRCFASRFISIVGGIVMSQRRTTMQRKATLLSFISARFLSAERRSEIFMEHAAGIFGRGIRGASRINGEISALIGPTSAALVFHSQYCHSILINHSALISARAAHISLSHKPLSFRSKSALNSGRLFKDLSSFVFANLQSHVDDDLLKRTKTLTKWDFL